MNLAYYSESLVPAAAKLAGVAPGTVDAEGAALELIGLCALTAAMSVLEFGLGLGDDKSASLELRSASRPPVPALRATVSGSSYVIFAKLD